MLAAFLDYIARTNLFNFVIFALIIAYVVYKIRVTEMLDKGTEAVADEIKEAESAKEDAKKHLESVEIKVANLEDEVKSIIKQSEDNAENVGQQIISTAEQTVNNINTEVSKSISTRTELLKNDIMKRASIASVEIARNHIINVLNDNMDLHNKLIDESIETINGVNI